MSRFLSDNFLLGNKTAEKLYFDYAKDMPIIDYHCHVSPREIYEDKHFNNITEIWLGGDHYKWRLMRANGVDEYYITGNAPDKEKFFKFAETLPKAIGNPMYHWCHLELKTYFGYEGLLNADTAQEVWELCNAKLAEEGMGARGIISASNVAFIGTTDDPTDTLEYHKLLAKDESFKTVVAPSFRPDKALNIDKQGWLEYIKALSAVSNIEICSIASLKSALCARIEYFYECGCRASDHGLDKMVYCEADDEQLEAIMQKALGGCDVSAKEAEAFKTCLLVYCASEYAKRKMAMQLHYNCMRNPNSAMFKKLGPDTGFDSMGPNDGAYALAMLLDRLYRENILPRTVVYSLDGNDNRAIDTIIGAFQGTECQGKIQHGSAWWFNDHKIGMEEHLTNLASIGLLGNFIGMLTDSRSFLSYTRHEYFRRILCNLVGKWVERGEYPNDEKALEQIIQGICYENAKNYFGI